MDHNVIGECHTAYTSNTPFVDFERTVIFCTHLTCPVIVPHCLHVKYRFRRFRTNSYFRRLTCHITRIVPLLYHFCIMYRWTSSRPEYSRNICLLDVKQSTTHQKERMTTKVDSIESQLNTTMIYLIKTQTSNLMRMTPFRKNLHQARSQPKDRKGKQFRSFWEWLQI